MEGALAVGASTPRIIFRHVLPNLMAPLIIIASILIGFAILTEAGLAFIGLGEPPPAQSWGREVNTGRQFMEDAPWLVLDPGLAITIVVLAFNMFGDALRDHLEPAPARHALTATPAPYLGGGSHGRNREREMHVRTRGGQGLARMPG